MFQAAVTSHVAYLENSLCSNLKASCDDFNNEHIVNYFECNKIIYMHFFGKLHFFALKCPKTTSGLNNLSGVQIHPLMKLPDRHTSGGSALLMPECLQYIIVK